MNYCFGIDIGGTSVKMGIFEENGNLLAKWQIRTRTEHQGEEILPDIALSVFEKQKEYQIPKTRILGIGAGVPAAVSGDGVVEDTTNLGWGYKEVKRELSKLTGYRVRVENDANLAALGEFRNGAGRGYRNMVMVTLGTGVGGGIIVDGRIVSGMKGQAGEIGEIYAGCETTADGRSVPRNLEYYASATGVARLAEKRFGKTAGPLSAKDVFERARRGEQAALEVVDVFGLHLGRALTGLAYTLAPEAFLIGGGMAGAGEFLLEAVRRHYNAPHSRLVLASLGNDAGIYGAAGLILS